MKSIEEVTTLYEISKALNEHLDLRKSLYKVLDILSNTMNMVRGTVTILNPVSNEISIEVAHGLSRGAMEKGKCLVQDQSGNDVGVLRLNEAAQAAVPNCPSCTVSMAIQ